MQTTTTRRPAELLALLSALAIGCGQPAPDPPAGEAEPEARAEVAPSSDPLRLFDHYGDATLVARLDVQADAIPRTEWRFDELDAENLAWKAGPDVGELELREGRLSGLTTGEKPLLHVALPQEAIDNDLLHEVVVRARVSDGKRLALRTQADFEGGFEAASAKLAESDWGLETPLLTGDEIRTYTLPPVFGIPTRQRIRHLILRPSDAAGARFEIESIRLVFRKEHLVGLDSGRGWYGLGEIYHESLLGRAGEAFEFDLTLPAQPRLEFEVGTIEEGAITFRVSRVEAGSADTLVERTVTTPDRWERVAVDLASFAGQPLRLRLSLEAALPAAIGIFGNPVVRSAIPDDEGPHGIIFILGDTLRRDHLGAYGYGRDTAPTLSRMADEGALFRDALVQGSWTKVSTPSIFTGLYQNSHGVVDFTTRLPAAATTMAEIFREAGYATLAYSSVPFTGKFNNMHQGYETLHEATSIAGSDTRREAKTAREYVDRFLDWFDDHRDTRFFALLHVFDPHDPFEPRSPYNALFADPEKRSEHVEQHEAVREFIDNPLRRNWGMPTVAEAEAAGIDPEAYIRYDLDWYDGAIRGMDAELARLLERLRASGRERDVLVVFTSDHGEEFHDHGNIIHGHSLYGELLRVPLIFWGPGRVPAGVDVPNTVQSIDILPTLLDLAGLPLPESIQGQSLEPLLVRGSAENPGGWTARPAFAERRPMQDAIDPEGGLDAVSVVSGRWKLIHNQKHPPERLEFELFDRVEDPREQTNVAAAHPEVVEQLSAEIVSWRERSDAIQLAQDEVDAEMSAGELERLRALGYVQ